MKRKIYQSLLLISCLFFGQSLQDEIVNVRGVLKEDLNKYQKTADNKFHCLDGNGIIPYEAINDDYCDCLDGSDEPGTSACSNGQFHCANEGHIPNVLQSSRVNDGVCDYDICCDGSDEYNGKIICENRCKEINEIFLKTQKEEEQLLNKGLSEKIKMLNEVNTLKKNDEEKIKQKNETIEIKKKEKIEIKAEIEKYEKLEKKYKDVYKTLYRKLKIKYEKIENDYQNVLKDILIIKDMNSCDLSKIKEITNKYDNSLIKNVIEENEKADEPKEEKNENENENESENKEEKSKLKKIDPEEEEEKERIKAIKENLSDLRSKRNNCDSEVRKLEDEIRKLEEKIENNHGPENIYYSIYQNTYTLETNEYTYELIWGEKINQKPKRGSATLLGKFDDYSDDFKTIKFKNGHTCWNGPKRSVNVILQCDSENKILSISEPNKCEYEMYFGTPAACANENDETNPDIKSDNNTEDQEQEHRHDEL